MLNPVSKDLWSALEGNASGDPQLDSAVVDLWSKQSMLQSAGLYDYKQDVVAYDAAAARLNEVVGMPVARTSTDPGFYSGGLRTPEELASDFLIDAARELMTLADGITGTGSVVDQMRGGQWNSWNDEVTAEGVWILTNRLKRASAALRAIKAQGPSDSATEHQGFSSFQQSVATQLPLNRKERYYTGTVLPGIVVGDDYSRIRPFLERAGIGPLLGEWNGPVQFWTEYGFTESVFTEHDRARFPSVDIARDTPDVVITGDDWILAVEAKLYSRPTAADLIGQLRRQRTLLDYWQESLSLPAENVRLVALLPEQYAGTLSGVQDEVHRIITWEKIRDDYSFLGDHLWLNTLHAALQQYGTLASKGRQFGANSQGKLSGREIVRQYEDGTLRFTHVGRSGGLAGSTLAQDVATGAWETQSYEVRDTPLEQRNWFSIEEFVARTRKP